MSAASPSPVRVAPPTYRNSLVKSLIKVAYDDSTDEKADYVTYDVVPSLTPLLHNFWLFQTPTDFDFAWYEASAAYVASLDRYEKYILSAYTRHGDEVANAFLRNPDGFQTVPRIHDLIHSVMRQNDTIMFAVQLLDALGEDSLNEYFFETGALTFDGNTELERLYPQVLADSELLKRFISQYVRDLEDIIRNAPRPEAYMLVFRGVKTDYLREVQDVPTAQKGFVSTSLNPYMGARFTGDFKHVYEMVIIPGTPCLALSSMSKFPDEMEILVSSETAILSSPRAIKHLLQRSQTNGGFTVDNFWTPAGPEVKTRTISVIGMDLLPANMGGRMSLGALQKAKASHGTKRTTRSRQKLHSRRPTRRSQTRMPASEQTPLLLPTYPLPSNIKEELRKALQTRARFNLPQ